MLSSFEGPKVLLLKYPNLSREIMTNYQALILYMVGESIIILWAEWPQNFSFSALVQEYSDHIQPFSSPIDSKAYTLLQEIYVRW